MTLPTLITLSRIILLIGLVVLHVLQPTWVGLSFVIFAIACISDFVDGYIARKLNQTSSLGAMLDQICDKILVVSVCILLADRGTLAGWGLLAATLIVTREFLVSGLREYAHQHALKIPVSHLGKWKTTFQMIALTVLMMVPFMQFAAPYWQKFGTLTLWISAILGIISAVGYATLFTKRSE